MDYRYSRTNDGARDVEPEYKSLGGLTRVLVTLLVASAIVQLIGVVSSWMQLDLLSRSYTDAEATANDAREQLVGGTGALVLLTTFVVFGFWIVRAHRNLPWLGAERLDFTPGWALGWFFIPIANLWKPYQAMRTLWKASHDGPRWTVEDLPWWFGVWWAVWIVNAFMGRVVDRLSRSQTVNELMSMTMAYLAARGVQIVLDVLAIALVLGIARAQAKQASERAAVAASIAAGAPPPQTDLRAWRV